MFLPYLRGVVKYSNYLNLIELVEQGADHSAPPPNPFNILCFFSLKLELLTVGERCAHLSPVISDKYELTIKSLEILINHMN